MEACGTSRAEFCCCKVWTCDHAVVFAAFILCKFTNYGQNSIISFNVVLIVKQYRAWGSAYFPPQSLRLSDTPQPFLHS